MDRAARSRSPRCRAMRGLTNKPKLLVRVCTLISSPDELEAAVARADCDAALVMSHHYEHDLAYLAAWLASAVPFIGVLGPRRRTRQMLDTLAGRGDLLREAEQRIHAPVGLDLGGETTEEIALSIEAEIQVSLAGRSGRPLRNREAPIHGGEEALIKAAG